MSIAPFRRAWAFALFFTLWMSVAGESLAQSTLGPNARRVLEYWGSHEDPAYVRDATPVLLRCEGEIGGYFGSQSQNSNPASVPHAPATFLNDAVLALRDARSGNFEPIERHLDKAESDHQSSGGHIATQMRLCFHRQVKASLSGAAPSASQSAIRPSAPVAASPSPVSDAARADAMAAFRAEWRAFRERHPIVRTWTEAEISQYQLFMGTNSLAILNRHKTNMAKEDYDAIAKPGIEMRDQGRARCPACKVEYPVKQLVAGLDTPSVSFQTQYRAAQDLYVSHEENERTRRRMADDASGASNGLFGALANIGKPSLIHNRANDATACIRVEPTGAQMEWGIEGRYRLRNSCSYPISASWCANTNECGGNRGNMWTIAPGKDWPIYFADVANPNIQVGACKAGDARQPPLGQQGVERTGFNAGRDTPAPAPGVSLLTRHRCD